MEDPEGFWAEAADAVHWDRKWDTVLDVSRPPFSRWFVGGVTNTCYNALDLHVEQGRDAAMSKIEANPFEVGLERNSANYVPLSPLSFLARAAAVYPGRIACIHGSQRTTYADLYARCRRRCRARPHRLEVRTRPGTDRSRF